MSKATTGRSRAAAILGQGGGKATSEAKAGASRANGGLGGRPRVNEERDAEIRRRLSEGESPEAVGADFALKPARVREIQREGSVTCLANLHGPKV